MTILNTLNVLDIIRPDDSIGVEMQVCYTSCYPWTEIKENFSLTSCNCRHVILPKEIAKRLPNKLMREDEWRNLGVQQSEGWVHFMRHNPGKHIHLFRLKFTSSFLDLSCQRGSHPAGIEQI